MRRRTKGRECSLMILYQADVTQRDIPTALKNYWAEQEEAQSVDSVVKEFSNRLTVGVDKNLKQIDEKIAQYATNWQIKRMAVIDRNVLRLGVFELLYTVDIPPKVSINEAVDLAKKYGDMDSGKFVNGILDKIHKTEVIVTEIGEKKIKN